MSITPLYTVLKNRKDAVRFARKLLVKTRGSVESESRARKIVEDVRAHGDAALFRLTRTFDRVTLSAATVRIPAKTIEKKAQECAMPLKKAMQEAAQRIEAYHRNQGLTPFSLKTAEGNLSQLVRPLKRVGIYVPGGYTIYPSSILMNAIPAKIAGVSQIAAVTPPHDELDPKLAFAFSLCGVSEVYRVGGAQAVAALAYGTETIPRVDKIVGPGNIYVALAKKIVFGDVDIDMVAGPSEVAILTDSRANPGHIALDMLSQAEHGTDSQVILVTTSATLANAVAAEVERQLASLGRADIAREAIGHSRAIIVNDLDEAVAVSNRYAPEHLIVQTADPRALLTNIINAGSVFLGPWTPESVGDYCSGTNHVLPTYGFARNYSGLGVDQFLRSMTVQELSREGLAGLGAAVVTLAGLEGLDAHANAVTLRLESGT